MEKVMKKLKNWIFAAAAAVTLTMASTASAGLIYGPGAGAGDIAAPGVYVGNGVQNGNWTGVNTGGIEVALRAKDRATFVNILPVGNVYQVDPGLCVGASCGLSTKADWNYEFSVSTIGAGADLLNYMIEILVDNNPTAGTTFNTLNAFTNWGDNEYWNITGLGSERSGPVTGLPQANERVVQQSVNPLFPNSGFIGFDVNQNGLYDIRMNVYSLGQLSQQRSLLASTDIQVKVGDSVPVPEPASLALAGLALAGIGLGRRKTNTKGISPVPA